MEKQLSINCAACDARFVQEETLAGFDRIKINAAVMLVTPESRRLLTKYGVSMNCSAVLELGADVQVSTVNGEFTIDGSNAPEKPQLLIVNGKLTVTANAKPALEKYVSIIVNGTLICPESLSGMLGKIQVSGATRCYPDGTIRLKSVAVIDRLFALRAKKSLYWADKRLIFVDPALDGAALAAKGARFASKEAIVAESKVEALLDLIDERTDIIPVPDGTAVVCDDVTLDWKALRRYGKKLYILGDVVAQDRQALEEVEYLYIRGDAKVDPALEELLLEKAEITGSVEAITPPESDKTVITDQSKVTVSAWLLEKASKGLLVEDCSLVTLDPDVTPEGILERLQIRDCAKVRCTVDQKPALQIVCQDVAAIASPDEESPDLQTRHINCANYVL